MSLCRVISYVKEFPSRLKWENSNLDLMQIEIEIKIPKAQWVAIRKSQNQNQNQNQSPSVHNAQRTKTKTTIRRFKSERCVVVNILGLLGVEKSALGWYCCSFGLASPMHMRTCESGVVSPNTTTSRLTSRRTCNRSKSLDFWYF